MKLFPKNYLTYHNKGFYNTLLISLNTFQATTLLGGVVML